MGIESQTRSPTSALDQFVRQRTVLLTTFKRNGAAVGTPVSIAVEHDRAFVRSYRSAWKVKRIANNDRAEVSPSTFRGARPAQRSRCEPAC